MSDDFRQAICGSRLTTFSMSVETGEGDPKVYFSVSAPGWRAHDWLSIADTLRLATMLAEVAELAAGVAAPHHDSVPF